MAPGDNGACVRCSFPCTHESKKATMKARSLQRDDNAQAARTVDCAALFAQSRWRFPAGTKPSGCQDRARFVVRSIIRYCYVCDALSFMLIYPCSKVVSHSCVPFWRERPYLRLVIPYSRQLIFLALFHSRIFFIRFVFTVAAQAVAR